jgi:hypothetical protein
MAGPEPCGERQIANLGQEAHVKYSKDHRFVYISCQSANS